MIKVPFLILIFLFNSHHLFAKEYNLSSWQKWQMKYNQTLIGKDGWLRLAGLYWLETGNNTLGSAIHNMHRLPDDTPADLGSITIYKDNLIFTAKYPEILVNGKETKLALLSTKKETRVAFDNYELFALNREGKYAVRLVNTLIDVDKDFAGAHFMPFDDSLIVQATLKPHQQPQTINVATVYGTNRKEKSAGWMEFQLDGVKHRIEAVDYGKDLPLYLFFADLTNGETTYDAGRYLKVEWPDKNGNTIVDFNRSYNPPCAYTPYATCPLTPPQNRLNIAIKAGELNFTKSK